MKKLIISIFLLCIAVIAANAQKVVLVKDFCQDSCYGLDPNLHANPMRVLGSKLFFGAITNTEKPNSYNWVIEGNNIKKLDNFGNTVFDSAPYFMDYVGGNAIVSGVKDKDKTDYIQGVWKQNLSTGTYELIKQNSHGYFARMNQNVYFASINFGISPNPSAFALHKIDTTNFSLSVVKDSIFMGNRWDWFTVKANQKKMYFPITTKTDASQNDIWVSDGTKSGTKKIAEDFFIYQSYKKLSAGALNFYNYNGHTYFFGAKQQQSDSINLYKIDYNTNEVKKVYQFIPKKGENFLFINNVIESSDILYIEFNLKMYRFNDKGIELVKTNKGKSISPNNFRAFLKNGNFFVRSNIKIDSINNQYQDVLIKIGENNADTKIVYDFEVEDITFLNNKWYFIGKDSLHALPNSKYYLWEADSNFQSVKKIFEPLGKIYFTVWGGQYTVFNLTPYNDDLYFWYNDEKIGAELYKYTYKNTNTSEITINQLKIYPNPSNDYVSIINPTYENAVLNIYDINGQKIKEEIVQKEANNIDISNLKSGIYVLKIQSEGKAFISKFIKI
jgi:Secretion system C-terminal sorting domain